MAQPILSVIIPVYNEEQSLPLLFARLYPALDKLGVDQQVLRQGHLQARALHLLNASHTAHVSAVSTFGC